MKPTARQRGEQRSQTAPPVIDRVASVAKTVGSAAQRAFGKAGLSERVHQNPLGMAAAALALGYVAGGGLFTRSTGRLISFAAQLARVPAVQDRFVELAEETLGTMLE